MHPDSGQAGQLFHEEWSPYQWVLDTDAMGHQGLIAATRGLLHTHYRSCSKALLDLGCGNGHVMSTLLQDAPIQTYIGIDQCDIALTQCRHQLEQQVEPRLVLINGDIFDLPSSRINPSPDVIFSAYAIHHGSRQQKQTLLGYLREIAAPGALFIFVDIMQEQGMSRQAFYQRINDYFLDCQGITTAIHQSILAHAQKADYPETPKTYLTIAKAAGWELIEARPLDIGRRIKFPAFLMVLRNPAS